MKQKRRFILSILFIPVLLFGQGISMLPSELPDSIFGSWVDDKNNVMLVVAPEYIVIQNELYYYNDIVKEKEVINLTCVDDFNVKYVSLTEIDSAGIYLDEGYKITKLVKNQGSITNKLPDAIIGKWYASKNEIKILEDEVLFSDYSYKVDYIISTDNSKHYFVLYKDGEYYFSYSYFNEDGHFLRTNFSKEILFKKESFFQKHFISFISIIILLFLFIGYYLFKWKIAMTKKKEVAKRMFTEMQLKSIRSQMNPHFLFNALSAIQNFINKGDSISANHYLTEFSQLMRLTLDKSEKGVVPLSDEIESIKKYLELEKLRFPFHYMIKIDPKIDTYLTEVPAMLIQPFVENAIIHGLNEKKGEKKLSIEFKIEEENLSCLIIDNGIGIKKAQAKKDTGLKREKYGLKLAENRINLINESYKTNAKVEIIDISNNTRETGTVVEILLPLRY
ncbi:sensor histidine kinase [Flavivirga jejuensis]|uniref:Histidine kinase n=1 Tax=Flavivirga jejuensis TaxID=870487 RepID=A0ABT8WMF8_9FLAO|nr:histidine kinase [Flavivirga jejuensis]MDO5974342.1 histidine kinase [Flavivirga jejuensis]